MLNLYPRFSASFRSRDGGDEDVSRLRAFYGIAVVRVESLNSVASYLYFSGCFTQHTGYTVFGLGLFHTAELFFSLYSLLKRKHAYIALNRPHTHPLTPLISPLTHA
jgi:hypothetical protein